MLVFLHLHKTAGTTLLDILRRSFGSRMCYAIPRDGATKLFTSSDYRTVLRLCPRLACIAGHQLRPWGQLEAITPNIHYFTYLREPLSRAASHFQYGCTRRRRQGRPVPTLEEWTSNPKHRNRQTQMIGGPDCSAEDALQIINSEQIFVGLMERFDESLLLLKRYFDLSEGRDLDIWYRSRNVARRNTVKHSLLKDPVSRALLLESNQEDVKLYEEVAKTIYPRQQADYGAALTTDVKQAAVNRAAVPTYPDGLPLELAWRLPQRWRPTFNYLAAVGLVRAVYRPALRVSRWSNSRSEQASTRSEPTMV